MIQESIASFGLACEGAIGPVWLLAIACPVVAYLIGATPFGMILAKMHRVDLRAVGSGNVGATNVGRALGRKWGILCFFLDMAKGLIPTLLAGMALGVQGGQAPAAGVQGIWLSVGVGCILGHIFSFYLKGRGGKGVATSLGVVLGVFPYFTWAGLMAFGLWIVVTAVSRYVSLGSVVAAVVFVPAVLLVNGFRMGFAATWTLWPMLAFATAMAILIIIKHRGNIGRLLRGEENRIGAKNGAKNGASTPNPSNEDASA